MLTPGLQLGTGLQPTNPIPTDSWAGPYASIAEANATVPSAVRFEGREVIIWDGIRAKIYGWYVGILDTDLEESSSSGSGGWPLNGTATLTGPVIIEAGGNPLEIGTVSDPLQDFYLRSAGTLLIEGVQSTYQSNGLMSIISGATMGINSAQGVIIKGASEDNAQGIQIIAGDANQEGSPDMYRLSMTFTDGAVFTDYINSGGLKYAADYSANYTNRSLVDKEYVDNAIGGGGGSGWPLTGSAMLTGNVTIDGGSGTPYEVEIGSTTNPLGEFNVRVINNNETTFAMKDVDGITMQFNNNTTTQISVLQLAGNAGGILFKDGGTSTLMGMAGSFDGSGFSGEVGLELYYLAASGTIGSTLLLGAQAVMSGPSATFGGLMYEADYSANYTNRSLVDKEYVDNAVAGGGGGGGHIIQDSGTPLAQRANLNITGGLKAVDDSGNDATVISLGGSLIEDILISGNNVYSIEFQGLITFNTSMYMPGGGSTQHQITGNNVQTIVNADPGQYSYWNVSQSSDTGISFGISLSKIGTTPHALVFDASSMATKGGFTITTIDEVDNSVRGVLILKRSVSDLLTPTDTTGLGAKIEFQVEIPGSAIAENAGISYVLTNAPDNTDVTGKYIFSLNAGGVGGYNTDTDILEIDQFGARYMADYSTNYTARSLVDKAYVDNVAGGSYTFSSGLTESGGSVTLGGPLTASVNITSVAAADAFYIGGYDPADFMSEIVLGAEYMYFLSNSAVDIYGTVSNLLNSAVSFGTVYTVDEEFSTNISMTVPKIDMTKAVGAAERSIVGTGLALKNRLPGTSDTAQHALAGFGVKMGFDLQWGNVIGMRPTGAGISYILDNPTVGSIEGHFEFEVLVASAPVTVLNLDKNGLRYEADYSANYVDRSLVDKQYVDTALSVGTWTLNGTTNLVGAVVIDGSGNNLDFENFYDYEITHSSGRFRLLGDGGYELLGTNYGIDLYARNPVADTAGRIRLYQDVLLLGSTPAGQNGYSASEYTTVIRFDATTATFVDNRATKIGLEYDADYSANYTNRSLVDKEYVDSAISGGAFTFENGLIEAAGVVKLGGALTEDTTISGLFNLTLGAQNHTLELNNGVGMIFTLDAGGYGFEFNGNDSTSGFDVNVGSIGVRFFAEDNGVDTNGTLSFTSQKTSTNTIATVANFQRSSSGTPANGIGAQILITTRNASNAQRSLSLQHQLVNAAAGAEDSLFAIRAYRNGTLTDFFKIEGDNGGLLLSTHYGVVNYNADFSANFTARSLVDKAYVDSVVAGGAFWPLAGSATLTNNVNIGGAFDVAFGGITGVEIDTTDGTTDTYAYFNEDGVDFGTANGAFDHYGLGHFEKGYWSIGAAFSGGVITLEAFTNPVKMQIAATGTFAATFAGIQYISDYSTNFVARSLVDKEYVDDTILSIVYPTPVTQNITGAVSIDLSTGTTFYLTLTGNVTSFTFTNEVVGRQYTFYFLQNTSYKTLAFTAGKFRFSLGTTPTLTDPTTNGTAGPARSVDILSAHCQVSGRLDAVLTQDMIEN